MLQKAWFFTSFLLLSVYVYGQTQTAVSLSTTIDGANSKGFYRHLPADYSISTKNYPLIIWVHGAGQIGQGNAAELYKVLEWGVPKIINEGGFPSSFTVGAENFSFIVISPQFMGWPSGGNIAGILTYVMNNYRVDPERIYLMGISAGGGGVWQYASASVANSNKIAAIIPFCGTTNATEQTAARIAASNLPVWAFHNTNDGTVPVANSRNWKNLINAYLPTPNPLAKLTEFPVVSNNAVTAHECWSLATLPSYKPDGINIYEWMLGYKKRIANINAQPVANAGEDQGVVLPAGAQLLGSSSFDPDGVIVSYKWTKLSGPVSYNFIDSTVANTPVGNLVQGTYQFQLTVTDNLGATSNDIVVVNVYPNLPQGAQQRILIDVGSAASSGGVITNSPNLNGNVWNNMTDARTGVRVANALTTNNQASGLSVEVINRVDGTFSTGSTGTGNGNNAVIVNDYPSSATTDHALIHKSATNGLWRIRGLDPNKVYTIKFWGARTNTTASRVAEIKRSDDNLWKSYNATGNTNYNNAVVFNITAKTQMDFNIRTKLGSDFSAINVIDISYSGSETAPINQPPIARAGDDMLIQLPIDSILLQGCNSIDPEQAILRYKWRKIAGPANYPIAIDTLCTLKVNGLTAGTYTFELLVTDTGGLAGKDTVAFVVNSLLPTPWPPQFATLCNTPYKVVVLGSSTAFGTGASPSDSSWVNKFKSYLQQQNTGVTLTNLAFGGFTSYHISPSGFIPPTNRPLPDQSRNITAALALNPDAIIINLPSNDAASSFSLIETQENFNRIIAQSNNLNIPVWVTTSQPRNGLTTGQSNNLIQFRDWVNQQFGTKAIDFWSTISNANGTINPLYDNGDGVHLNNYGHHILFSRVVGEKVWDTICKRNNITPIAIAGNDTTINTRPFVMNLDAGFSYDPDGTIIEYNWRVINNSNVSVTPANNKNAVFSTTIPGNYLIELRVTDNLGKYHHDTISIHAITNNAPPVANAGTDQSAELPFVSINLNASGSIDTDGSILSYRWKKIIGNGTVIISDSTAIQTSVNFTSAGIYQFELTVADNEGDTDKDTVSITIHPDPNQAPIANAGPDQTLQLPLNRVIVNGNNSFDPEGSALTFNWQYLSGPAGSQLLTANKDTSSIIFTSAGSYIFRLTVTDASGLSSSDNITINVLPIPSSTKRVKVNLFGGTNPFNDPQWNNWNLNAGVNSNKFLYEDLSLSNINASISSVGQIRDNGSNYASTSTICPPAILRYISFNTSYVTLTLKGFNTNKKYNFEFYASRINSAGNSTVFRIGDDLDTISTNNNISDYAKFYDIIPDNDGNVIVIISRIGTYHYFAGFMITETGIDGMVGRSSGSIVNTTTQASLSMESFTGDAIAYPNPFKDNVSLNISSLPVGPYLIQLTDAAGKIVLQQQMNKQPGANVGTIKAEALKTGVYYLQIIGSTYRTTHKIIKL